VGGYRDEGNLLLERMQDALRKAPWQAFSDAAAAALEVHARALLKESYARELRA